MDPPNIALAKTEPWRLGFGIWLQLGPPLAHCPIPPHHLLLARCVAVSSFRPHLVYRHIQSSKLTAFVSFPIYIGEKATSCASTRNHLGPTILYFQLPTRHIHRLFPRSFSNHIYPSPLPFLRPSSFTYLPHPNSSQIQGHSRAHVPLQPERIQHTHPLVHGTL